MAQRSEEALLVFITTAVGFLRPPSSVAAAMMAAAAAAAATAALLVSGCARPVSPCASLPILCCGRDGGALVERVWVRVCVVDCDSIEGVARQGKRAEAE